MPIAVKINSIGIEVHSSILSANAVSNIPNEVRAVGMSLDCHLLIFFADLILLKFINSGIHFRCRSI